MKHINLEELRQFVINNKELKEITCSRCKGTGMTDHLHVDNGVCFKCNGKGTVQGKWLKIYFRIVGLQKKWWELGESRIALEKRTFRNECSKLRNTKYFKKQYDESVEAYNQLALKLANELGVEV